MWSIINDIQFFFYNPINVKITIFSLFISLVCFGLMRYRKMENHKRAALIYIHILALVFPVIFFTYSMGCTAWFYGCSRTQTMFYITFLALLSGVLAVMFTMPYIYLYRQIKRSSEAKGTHLLKFAKIQSALLGIKPPKLYFLNISRPVAFSISAFKPSVFMSVGLLDLLNYKESQAVLIHELAHIRNSSSLLKFSSVFMRFISPLSYFTTFHNDLDAEEKKADDAACIFQNTNRHVDSAKRKINEYNNFRFIE